MKHLFHYFSIIRPLNVLLSGITVLLASYLLDEFYHNLTFIVMIVVMLSCSFANIINDLFDIETDRVNKPNRSIIFLNNLRFNYNIFILAIVLFITIITLATFYFSYQTILLLCFIFLLIITYTPFFKGIPLIGNIIISFILSSVFIFTELALKESFLNSLYFPSLLTFLLTLIREIIKDIADIDGDKQSKINTLPIVAGVHFSKYIITIITIFLIVISYINIYNIYYLFSLVLLVQIPLVVCIFYLWKDPNFSTCIRLTIATKYITIGGIITILLMKLFN